jgi:hypothetical protein
MDFPRVVIDDLPSACMIRHGGRSREDVDENFASRSIVTYYTPTYFFPLPRRLSLMSLRFIVRAATVIFLPLVVALVGALATSH